MFTQKELQYLEIGEILASTPSSRLICPSDSTVLRKIYNALPEITRALWSKMEMEEIARWAWIFFVVIAIVAGLAVGWMAFNNDPNVAETSGWITLVMLILGIIVGITSITAKEITPFLIATIALLVAGIGNVWEPLLMVDALELFYYWATYILGYIIAFAAPAAVIISIKAVLAITRQK